MTTSNTTIATFCCAQIVTPNSATRLVASLVQDSFTANHSHADAPQRADHQMLPLLATSFATGLANPRRLLVLANDDVLVAEHGAGYITLLRDDGEGHAKWLNRHVAMLDVLRENNPRCSGSKVQDDIGAILNDEKLVHDDMLLSRSVSTTVLPSKSLNVLFFRSKLVA